MVEALQNLDLILDADNWVSVTPQKFFLEDFDSGVVLCANLLSKVYLTGVALAEGLKDLVLSIEYGMRMLFVALSHCAVVRFQVYFFT